MTRRPVTVKERTPQERRWRLVGAAIADACWVFLIYGAASYFWPENDDPLWAVVGTLAFLHLTADWKADRFIPEDDDK